MAARRNDRSTETHTEAAAETDRVADPSSTPTLPEALPNPHALGEAMEETTPMQPTRTWEKARMPYDAKRQEGRSKQEQLVPYPLQVGSLVVARRDSGVCAAGERGVCCELYKLNDRPGYGILFQRGGYDGFSPDEVKAFLEVPGRICPEVATYRFINVSQLARDFQQGRFAPAFTTLLPPQRQAELPEQKTPGGDEQPSNEEPVNEDLQAAAEAAEGMATEVTSEHRKEVQPLTRNYERNYERLTQLLGGRDHVRIECGGYMPLVVENLGGNQISLCHYGERNGGAMRNPMVCFLVEGSEAKPAYFRNDFAGVEHATVPDRFGYVPVKPRLQKDLDRFAETWFSTLHEQGLFEKAQEQRHEPNQKGAPGEKPEHPGQHARTTPKVTFLGQEFELRFDQYPHGGRTALLLVEPGKEDEFVVATVNEPEARLAANQVLIKDYSENRGVLDSLVRAAVVRPTGEIVRSGFASLPVCELLVGPPQQAPAKDRDHETTGPKGAVPPEQGTPTSQAQGVEMKPSDKAGLAAAAALAAVAFGKPILKNRMEAWDRVLHEEEQARQNNQTTDNTTQPHTGVPTTSEQQETGKALALGAAAVAAGGRATKREHDRQAQRRLATTDADGAVPSVSEKDTTSERGKTVTGSEQESASERNGENAERERGNRPLKKVESGVVRGFLWDNGPDREPTFTLARIYKHQESGKWQYTQSFRPRDLGDIGSVVADLEHAIEQEGNRKLGHKEKGKDRSPDRDQDCDL
jgi:hypothetical protein